MKRVAIVTGAANGIGAGIATSLLAEDYTVLLTDIQDERGHELARQLGPDATYRRCDVTSEADVAAAVDTAVGELGGLHCMVNNAGMPGARGPIDQIEAADWDRTMAIVLRSVFLGAKHAARVMKPQRAGVIVSTTSVAGVHGGFGPHGYTAAKHAIVGLTKNLAAELGPFRIRVNAVAPGYTVTPLNAAQTAGDVNDLDGLQKILEAISPLEGRVGFPKDMGDAVAWLASDRAGFVSGHTLVVDGGSTVGAPPASAERGFL